MSNATNGTIEDSSATVTIVENDVSNLSWSDIENGVNGYSATGVEDYQGIGWRFENVGDVNGDGIDDLFVRAYRSAVEPNDTYLYYGNEDGVFDFSTLDGSNGVRFQGSLLYAVGDINNDGLADFKLGGVDHAAHSIVGNPGTPYVGDLGIVLGRADWGSGVLDFGANGENTDSLLPVGPENRLVVTYNGSTDNVAVIPTMDINGDGLNDLFVTMPNYDGPGDAQGRQFVLFGTESGLSAVTELTNYNFDGSDGFTVDATNANSTLGWVGIAETIGDVNGDGFADMVVDVDQDAMIIFGGSNVGATGSITVDDIDGTNGILVRGMSGSMTNVGDLNGDGIDDLASGYNIILGRSSFKGGQPEYNVLDLTNVLFDGDTVPLSDGVRSGGDINGDGFDDLLVNGYRSSDPLYVIYGSDTVFSLDNGLLEIDPASYVTRQNGFSWEHTGSTANSVLVPALGDWNGDGFADIAAGDYVADENGTTNGGIFGVVYGGDFTGSISASSTQGDDFIEGTQYADALSGGNGDDHICGEGGADAISGGSGNDTIVVGDASFQTVDGGGGYDTLVLGGNGIDIDFTAVSSDLVTGMEEINITGNGSNMLTLDTYSVLGMSDTSNTLLIHGDQDDSITLTTGEGGSSWQATGTTTIEGQIYSIYEVGLASVIIDNDVQIVV